MQEVLSPLREHETEQDGNDDEVGCFTNIDGGGKRREAG